ncbi:hypothetical protein RI367_003223 [Sorochytrium milnesiophthora]
MSNHPDELKSMQDALDTVMQSKQPISTSKIQTITKTAIAYPQHYKHSVAIIFNFIKNAPPSLKLSGLYVVDAVVRGSLAEAKKRSSYNSGLGDPFSSRFELFLPSLTSEVQKCGEKEKEKIKKLIDVWRTHYVFRPDFLEKAEVKWLATGGDTPTKAATTTQSNSAPAETKPAVDTVSLIASLSNLAQGSASPALAYPGQDRVADISVPPASNGSSNGAGSGSYDYGRDTTQHLSSNMGPASNGMSFAGQKRPGFDDYNNDDNPSKRRFDGPPPPPLPSQQHQPWNNNNNNTGNDNSNGSGNFYNRNNGPPAPFRNPMQRFRPDNGHFIARGGSNQYANVDWTVTACEPNRTPSEWIQMPGGCGPEEVKVLSRTLYIGGIAPDVTREFLYITFSQFGPVDSILLNHNKHNCFLKLRTRRATNLARQACGTIDLGHTQLRVNWGCGFGPKDIFDFSAGVSIIPLARLEPTERRWLMTCTYGGVREGTLRGGLTIEEPEVVIPGQNSSTVGMEYLLSENNIAPTGPPAAGYGQQAPTQQYAGMPAAPRPPPAMHAAPPVQPPPVQDAQYAGADPYAAQGYSGGEQGYDAQAWYGYDYQNAGYYGYGNYQQGGEATDSAPQQQVETGDRDSAI